MSEDILQELDDMFNELEDDAEDLNLDGYELEQIPESIKTRIEKLKNLKSVSISENPLETLKNFPKLPSVERLEIFQGSFPGKELKDLVPLIPKVKTLLLGENSFENYDDIKVLAQLKNLENLSLAGCPLAEKDDYRDKIFGMIPQLKILDDEDKDGNAVEVDEDDEEEEEDYDPEDEDEDGDAGGEEEEEEEDDEEDYEEEATKKKKTKKN